MSCKDKCNKGCGCRSVITKQGLTGVQGPVGPPGRSGTNGSDGADGADGAPGAPGVSGMTYEDYKSLVIDFSWLETEELIPGTSRSVGADGNYQVHVASSHNLLADASGDLSLYVNGVAVITTNISAPSGYVGVKSKEVSMVWRGPLLNGQTIELRSIKGSAIFMGTQGVQILINKEL